MIAVLARMTSGRRDRGFFNFHHIYQSVDHPTEPAMVSLRALHRNDF
jgi:hypothetical protein